MNRRKKLKLDGVILNQKNICELMKIISKYISNPSIDVEFFDESACTNLTIEEFGEFNFDNRKIEKIDINAYIIDKGAEYVTLEKDYDLDKYVIEFSHSNHDEFSKLKADIEEWLISVKPRKKLISFVHSWVIYLLTGIIFCVPVVFLSYWWQTQIFQDEIYSIFCSSLIGVLLIFPMPLLLQYLFPFTELDIGINKRKTGRKFLWGIMTLFIIPLVISIIAAGL